MKTNYEILVDLVIKAEIDSKPRHEVVLEVCDTPETLLRIGFAPLRVVIKAKAIGKIFFDHGLTQRLIEKIPAILENPQAVYTSATHPASVVVFTYEVHAGSPIIIPVARDRQIGRGPLVNEVTSMYGKTGPDPRPRWRAEGLLLWEVAPKRNGPA